VFCGFERSRLKPRFDFERRSRNLGASPKVGADAHIRPSKLQTCTNQRREQAPALPRIKFIPCYGRFFAVAQKDKFPQTDRKQVKRRAPTTENLSCSVRIKNRQIRQKACGEKAELFWNIYWKTGRCNGI